VQGSICHSTPNSLFEKFYLKDDLLQTKFVILICSSFVTLLVTADYLNVGFSSAFNTILCIRITFLLFSAMILRILKQVKTVQQHDYLILLRSFFFIALIIYVNISRSVTNINFSYIDTLIVLVFRFILRRLFV